MPKRAQFRDKKTGKLYEVRWKDGEQPPSFESIGAALTGTTPFNTPELEEGKAFSLPEITVEGEDKTALGIPADSMGRVARQSNLLAPTTRENDPVFESRRASMENPEQILTDPRINLALLPLSGLRNLPGAMLSGAEKMGKGIMQGLSVFHPAIAAQYGVKPSLLEGGLNTLTGAARMAGGAAMAFTPVGAALSGAGELFNMEPTMAKAHMAVMSPAQLIDLGHAIGVQNPENAESVNELVDTIWQIGILKKAGGMHGGRMPGLPTESAVSIERGIPRVSTGAAIKKWAESKGVTFGEQPLPADVAPKNIPLALGSNIPVESFEPRTLGNRPPGDLLGAILPGGEKIVRAALRFGGKIYDGADHGEAMAKLEKALGRDPYEVLDFGRPDAQGFLTDKGRYITRHEAAQVAKDAGQLLRGDEPMIPRLGLQAEDVFDRAYDPMVSSVVPGAEKLMSARLRALKDQNDPDAVGKLLGIQIRLAKGTKEDGEFEVPGLGVYGGRLYKRPNRTLAEEVARFLEPDEQRQIKLKTVERMRAHRNSLGLWEEGAGELRPRETVGHWDESRLKEQADRLIGKIDALKKEGYESFDIDPGGSFHEHWSYPTVVRGAGGEFPLTPEGVVAGLKQHIVNMVDRWADLYADETGKRPSKQKKLEMAGEMLEEAGIKGGSMMSGVTPLAPQQVNAMIQKMARGKEIPFVWDTKKGELLTGNPGDPHSIAFSKPSSKLARAGVVGRIDEGGRVVALWGDRDTWTQQQISDALWSMIEQGKVKKDALVYWSDSGEGMRIKDAIGGGELNVSYLPGVDAATVRRGMEKVLELTASTGGSTVDPKSGEAITPKGMASVSPYPERSLIVDGALTQKAYMDFVKKNGDLLRQDDHYVGSWKDPESGKTYLDVVIALPKDQATALGTERNQKAIYDFDSGSEIKTGGTGEPVPGPAFDYEKYRSSRLSPEEAAQRAARTTDPAFAKDFGEQSNQIEAAKRIIEHQRSLGFKDIPTEDFPGSVRRLVESTDPIVKDFMREWDAYTSRTGEVRQKWYEGPQRAKPILEKHYPKLADQNNYDLFTTINSIFSNGNDPVTEFLNGVVTWENFEKTGRISSRLPEIIGSVRDDVITRQLAALGKLVKQRGVEGAAEWLRGEHTTIEIAEMRKRVGLSDSGVFNEPGKHTGASMFGPKLGRYTANKMGMMDYVTNDKWMNLWGQIARGVTKLKRTTDRPDFPIPEGSESGIDASGVRYVEQLSGQATPLERQIQTEAVTQLAKEYGVTPADMQAIIWTHVVRPAFERAGQTMKGAFGDHGDFARRLDEAGWFTRRLGKEGAALEEGRTITREGGLSDAAQRGPERFRRKGDSGEDGGDTSFDFGSVKSDIIPGAEKVFGEGSKYAGSINLERMAIGDEQKERMRKDADVLKQMFQKEFGWKLTDEEVINLAKDQRTFNELLTNDMKRTIAAQVLRLRQAVAAGGAVDKPTEQYYRDFVTLQSAARFFGTMLQKFGIEADQIERPEGGVGQGVRGFREDVLSRIFKTAADADLVIKRAESVNWKDAQEVSRFYREFVKPQMSELLDEFRYINMLSSPRTHIINAFSNIIQVSGLAPVTKLASGATDLVASALTGKERTHYMAETPAYFRGFANAVPKAIEDAAAAMRGKSATHRFDASRIPSMGVAATKMGVPLAKFNQIMAPVTRALEASDIFFRRLAEGGEFEARSVRDVKSGVPLDIAKLQKEAMDAAEYWVFRKGLDIENKTGQGAVLTQIDKLTNGVYQLRKVPVAKWFLPFIMTPMNILKQGIEYSPAGFITMLKSTDKVEAFSKAMIGSTVFAGAAGLVATNESTWADLTDDEKAAGKIPYAIKIGGQWRSFSKLGPLAYPVALAVAYKHYTQDDQSLQKKEYAERLLKAAQGYAKFFSDQSYVQGLADLTNAAQGKTDWGTGVALNLGRQLVPLTAAQTWVNGVLDGTRRAPENIFERFESALPGLSKDVSPRYTPLGSEAKKPGAAGNLFSPVATGESEVDPVVLKLDELGIKVGLPSKTIYGITLPERTYQQYVKAQGEELYKRVSKLVGHESFASIPKGEIQDIVDGMKDEVRDEVGQKMFPLYYKRWMEKRGTE